MTISTRTDRISRRDKTHVLVAIDEEYDSDNRMLGT